jgi:hypothetical protein
MENAVLRLGEAGGIDVQKTSSFDCGTVAFAATA